MWFVSLWLGFARAECPDPGMGLADAERDVLSFFLVEAEASLAAVAQAFGCGPAEPGVLGRYWRLQAMIWHLQENPLRDRALSAARRDDPAWDEALGEELRALWAEAEPNRGGVAELRVRGARRGDALLLDGVEWTGGQAAEGLHVFQVRRGEVVVFGRVVDLGPEGLDIAVSSVGPSVPEGPVWTADWPGPPTWSAFTIRDAAGDRLRLGRDIAPVALQTSAGRELWPSYRRNARFQRWAVGAAALGLYGTALFAGESARGSYNYGEEATGVGLFGSALVMTGGAAWEVALLARRAKIRRGMLEATASIEGAP